MDKNRKHSNESLRSNSVYLEWLVQREHTKLLESKLHNMFRTGTYFNESGSAAEREYIKNLNK